MYANHNETEIIEFATKKGLFIGYDYSLYEYIFIDSEGKKVGLTTPSGFQSAYFIVPATFMPDYLQQNFIRRLDKRLGQYEEVYVPTEHAKRNFPS